MVRWCQPKVTGHQHKQPGKCPGHKLKTTVGSLIRYPAHLTDLGSGEFRELPVATDVARLCANELQKESFSERCLFRQSECRMEVLRGICCLRPCLATGDRLVTQASTAWLCILKARGLLTWSGRVYFASTSLEIRLVPRKSSPHPQCCSCCTALAMPSRLPCTRGVDWHAQLLQAAPDSRLRMP